MSTGTPRKSACEVSQPGLRLSMFRASRRRSLRATSVRGAIAASSCRPADRTTLLAALME